MYADLKGFLGIALLKSVRILNRYDVEDIDEALFEKAIVNEEKAEEPEEKAGKHAKADEAEAADEAAEPVEAEEA